jgi:hypothetical protein
VTVPGSGTVDRAPVGSGTGTPVGGVRASNGRRRCGATTPEGTGRGRATPASSPRRSRARRRSAASRTPCSPTTSTRRSWTVRCAAS